MNLTIAGHNVNRDDLGRIDHDVLSLHLAMDVEHYPALEPLVFARDANLKALKEYLRTLRGSTVLVIDNNNTVAISGVSG